MKAINCPICGKLTYPDYCSDECLYRHYERERIIELLNEELTNCYCETPLTHLDARIKETK